MKFNCRVALFILHLLVATFKVGKAHRIPLHGSAMAFAARSKPKKSSTGQPDYQLASLDLSQKWLELVRNGQVEATVEVPASYSDGGDKNSPEEMLRVRYGVAVSKEDANKCQEFVEQVETEEPHEKIRVINETLAQLQSDPSKISVQYEMDGDFVAQLQLVRTLRPAPSPGFAGSTSSEPPPYDEKTDSFVTGPLRLELRPVVGTVKVPGMVTRYDIYHNVSPADARGHFLLLPTLSLPELNWRGQKFLPTDFTNMLYLASSVRPHGSLFLGFNSVGAGASQNHIHCHAWPSPPLPFLNEQEDDSSPVEGWNCYAVSKVKSIIDFYDLDGGNIEVTYLKYPLFCVQFSASKEHLDTLSKVLDFASAAFGEAPFNIGFLNRPAMDDDGNTMDSEDDSFVDVYMFVRSKERSSVLPSLKLGVSEAMGLFHAQSDEELGVLKATTPLGGARKVEDAGAEHEHDHHHDHHHDHDDGPKKGPMAQALEDISYVDRDELWSAMKTILIGLDATIIGIDEETLEGTDDGR
ncbi:unnamed protein product [Cylindrotheca closterium]|uniref:GDP-D-glucose phosphorylase n=1 Tax=Cylindrotheca closterium TaxID=2856 RepID=A0AAD2CDV3_9STRA|nr:unnamed protein product [Cylindrotheca closterium]